MKHPDLTELQRRSERQRKALAQAAKREPTTQERRTWRIMLRAALIQQRDRERGLL